jgi:hypothetical protein
MPPPFRQRLGAVRVRYSRTWDEDAALPHCHETRADPERRTGHAVGPETVVPSSCQVSMRLGRVACDRSQRWIGFHRASVRQKPDQRAESVADLGVTPGAAPRTERYSSGFTLSDERLVRLDTHSRRYGRVRRPSSPRSRPRITGNRRRTGVLAASRAAFVVFRGAQAACVRSRRRRALGRILKLHRAEGCPRRGVDERPGLIE